jgi:two-component system, NarL family, nitrate/nitrite response regulator NarL
MITLILVDDQAAVRQGLRMRLQLEPDLRVVGEAGDGLAALALAEAKHPDVVLLDLEMPGMDGIATTLALRSTVANSAVVLLSIHHDAAQRARALSAGASAFVEKTGGIEPLLAAIRRAAACQPIVSQE